MPFALGRSCSRNCSTFARNPRLIGRILTHLFSRNKDALQDIEAVLAQVPRDVLSLSLRAIIRGNDGDAAGALADLATTNAAVRAGKAYRSRLGDDDADLEYLARGWAYCSVCSSLSTFSHGRIECSI